MRFHQLSVLSVLAAVPFANFATPLPPPWHDMRIKHTWNAVPPNWEALGHPPNDTTIDLYIALKPHHENALSNALYKVSDPRSPKYGAHLSKEQVALLVAPHPDTLGLISSWLEYHAVPSSSISRTHGDSWLKLTGIPVSKANELLGASYQVYRRIGTNDSSILRTRRSVGVTVDVSSGEPVTVLPDKVTPSDLRGLYRTAQYVPMATDQNLVGITGFVQDYPSPDDLKEFMTECRTDAEDATFRFALVNGGGYDPSHPSDEANLNMQYSQAIAYPTPHTFYSTGGEVYIHNNEPDSDDVWLGWLIYLLSLTDVPQTISAPYADFEKALPLEYTTSLCNLFGQLGLRGASVIFTSGNDGVGRGNCLAEDGSGRVEFIPEFPGSCHFVTAVGGTMGYPEAAAPLSGGGFSNHFPRPFYQKFAVPAFLRQLGGQYYGSYNAQGRGIPDISAQALKYFIILNGEGLLVDGTSCSAPTVAAIISLLNDYRLSKGKKALGFLNPWLYGLGLNGLNDITSGSNPGCGTDGFTAIPGWDPVTGLGTPNFVALQQTLDYMVQVQATYNEGIRTAFSERQNNSDTAVLLA